MDRGDHVGGAAAARAGGVTAAVFLMLGCIAGFLWAALAEPASFMVAGGEAAMGELEAGQEFGVDVVFASIACVCGLAAGSFLGWRYHRIGWPQVLSTVAAATVAGLLAWKLGVWLGPADPASLLPSTPAGGLLPQRLDVHAPGLLLVWPVSALVGLIASVYVAAKQSGPPRALPQPREPSPPTR